VDCGHWRLFVLVSSFYILSGHVCEIKLTHTTSPRKSFIVYARTASLCDVICRLSRTC